MCVHRPRALSEDCGVFGAVDEQYGGALGGDEQLGEDGVGQARCEPGIGCCYIFTFLCVRRFDGMPGVGQPSLKNAGWDCAIRARDALAG